MKCPTCLETFNSSKSTVTTNPCGHLFHEDCIQPWLENDKQGRNKVQKIGGANPPKKSFKNSYFPLLYGPSKKIGGAIAPPAPPVVTALYLHNCIHTFEFLTQSLLALKISEEGVQRRHQSQYAGHDLDKIEKPWVVTLI